MIFWGTLSDGEEWSHSSLAAKEEPDETQGHHPGEDAAEQRPEPAGDHPAGERLVARLVRVLPAQLITDVQVPGLLDSETFAQRASQTLRSPGSLVADAIITAGTTNSSPTLDCTT